MVKIWEENRKSKVIGRFGGDEKNKWPRRTDNCWRLKQINSTILTTNINKNIMFASNSSATLSNWKCKHICISGSLTLMEKKIQL